MEEKPMTEEEKEKKLMKVVNIIGNTLGWAAFIASICFIVFGAWQIGIAIFLGFAFGAIAMALPLVAQLNAIKRSLETDLVRLTEFRDKLVHDQKELEEQLNKAKEANPDGSVPSPFHG